LRIVALALGLVLSFGIALVLHFRWDSFSIHLHQTNNSDPIYRRILFLGDSITEQGTRPRGFITKIESVLTIDSQIMAKPGATTDEVQMLLQSLSVPFQPDLVITQSGINDYAEGQSQSDIAQNHEDLIAKISRHYPNSSIWLLPIHPFKERSKLLEFNASATKSTIDRWWKDKNDFSYHYLHEDGIHLSATGNTKLARILIDKLTQSNSRS
jgi:lysophospholipase L1-like esterase